LTPLVNGFPTTAGASLKACQKSTPKYAVWIIVSSINEVDILCVLETKNPVKPNKAVCPVMLEEAEYPGKLDEADNPVKLD